MDITSVEQMQEEARRRRNLFWPQLQAPVVDRALVRPKMPTRARRPVLADVIETPPPTAALTVKLDPPPAWRSLPTTESGAPDVSDCYQWDVLKLLRDWAAHKHKIKSHVMLSESRLRPVVMARRDWIYEICKQTDWSYKQIGNRLGCDHTTVLHAIKRADVQYSTSVHLKRSLKK